MIARKINKRNMQKVLEILSAKMVSSPHGKCAALQ
jgi:hypothetical protein